MEWTIYSVGDGAFLAAILNGLAVLSNNGTFASLARVGLAAGILIVTVRGLLGNTGPAFQQIAFGILVFVGAFSSPATVLVEDVYVGTVRPVANVPLGIAASGAMISRIGYGITATFEQGFSAPSMTAQGWNNGLHVIHTARRTTLSEEKLGMANTAQGGNFWQSWRNYLLDCTLKMHHLQGKQFANFTLANDFALEMEYRSDTFFTKLFLPSGTGHFTCKDAYPLLVDYSNTIVIPMFFSKTLTATNYKASRPEYSGVSSRDELADALGGLGLSISPEQWILASVVERVWSEAVAQWHIQNLNYTYAETVMAGLAQRAESWIAESGMFERMIRPSLTFVEGMIFAITPLIALMIGVGGGGLVVLSNYLKILAWVQLWWPLLAVVHLYTHFGMTGKMDAIQTDGSLSQQSLAFLIVFDQEILDWMSTAGMLAAAVPGFAIALVWGGTVAFTSLMGKMQGGDHFEEKAVARSVMGPAPMVQQKADFGASQAQGLHKLNTPEFNIQQAMQAQQQVSATKRQLVAATDSFAHTLSDATGTSISFGSDRKVGESVRSGDSQKTTDAYSATHADGTAVSRATAVSTGTGSQTANQEGGQVQLASSFGFGVGDGFGAKINFGPSGSWSRIASNHSKMEATEQTSKVRTDNEAVQESKGTEKAREVANSIVNDKSRSWAVGMDASKADAVQRAASQVLTADRAHQEAVSKMQTTGVGMSMNTADMNFLAQNGGMAAVHRLRQSLPDFAKVHDELMASRFTSQMYATPEQQFMGAALMASAGMGHSNVLSPESKELAFNTILAPTEMPAMTTANAFADTKEQTRLAPPPSDQLPSFVQNRLGQPSSLPDSPPTTEPGKTPAADDSSSSAPPPMPKVDIDHEYGRGMGDVGERGVINASMMNHKHNRDLADQQAANAKQQHEATPTVNAVLGVPGAGKD